MYTPALTVIFGNFLQSSAGTTPIYEHLKTMQEMMQHECHKLGAIWGGFGHEFTKNRVVPALLFFLPPGANFRLLAIFGSRKPLCTIIISKIKNIFDVYSWDIVDGKFCDIFVFRTFVICAGSLKHRL